MIAALRLELRTPLSEGSASRIRLTSMPSAWVARARSMTVSSRVK